MTALLIAIGATVVTLLVLFSAINIWLALAILAALYIALLWAEW